MSIPRNVTGDVNTAKDSSDTIILQSNTNEQLYSHENVWSALYDPPLLTSAIHQPDGSLVAVNSNRQLSPRSPPAELGTGNEHTLRLLLLSTIELLCKALMPDNTDVHRKHAYLYTCELLVSNGIMPSAVVSDEYSPVRQQYSAVLERMLNMVTTHFLTIDQHANTANSTVRIASATSDSPGEDWQFESERIEVEHSLKSVEFGASTSSLFQPARQSLSDQTDASKSTGNLSSGNLMRNFMPSRFEQDFRDVAPIGKGGFAQVLKARHVVDECVYALKKVQFNNSQSSLCLRVLREIRMLARLQHGNIVRYYGAWFELETNSRRSGAGDVLAIGNATYASINAQGHQQHSTSTSNGDDDQSGLCLPRLASPDITFGYGTDQSLSRQHNYNKQPMNTQWSDKDESSEPSGKPMSIVPILRNSAAQCSLAETPPPHGFVVYIQMQLGMGTLHSYLMQRRELMTSDADEYQSVDEPFNQRVLHQLLSAIDYIHANAFIHRDIKGFQPSNIFLHGTDSEQNVLLGDFGLACYEGQIQTTSGHGDVSLGNGDNTSTANTSTASVTRSQGLGTVTYAAPEQLTTNDYTKQVDMYSFGIVAYELYQPMGTNMHRVKCLQRLRQSLFDTHFECTWPIQCGLIRQCVHPQAECRPTASSLLKGSCFVSDNQRVSTLEDTVRRQTARLKQLEMQLHKHNIQIDE